jgi:hypothetical protein
MRCDVLCFQPRLAHNRVLSRPRVCDPCPWCLWRPWPSRSVALSAARCCEACHKRSSRTCGRRRSPLRSLGWAYLQCANCARARCGLRVVRSCVCSELHCVLHVLPLPSFHTRAHTPIAPKTRAHTYTHPSLSVRVCHTSRSGARDALVTSSTTLFCSTRRQRCVSLRAHDHTTTSTANIASPAARARTHIYAYTLLVRTCSQTMTTTTAATSLHVAHTHTHTHTHTSCSHTHAISPRRPS